MVDLHSTFEFKTYHGILGYSIFWFWQFRFISFGWKVSDSFDVFKACKDGYESPSDIILACQEILGATLHLMLAGLLGRQVEGPNQRFVTQRLQVRWHNQWQLSRLRFSSRFQATEDPFNGYRMFNWDMLPHGLYPHIPLSRVPRSYLWWQLWAPGGAPWQRRSSRNLQGLRRSKWQ